jgi:hypothetical protein
MIEASQARRRLLLALGSIGAAALASCSNGQDDEPSAAATLANHDKIVDALNELSSAVDSLEQSIGGFDDDNWREVVPEVKTAASNVSDALATLKDLMAGNDAS